MPRRANPDFADDTDFFDAGTADGDRPRRRRRRTGLRVLVVGLVTLALLAVGTVAAYVAFLQHTVSENVSHEDLLADAPITAEDGTVVTPSAPPRPAEAGDARNFLILGSDSRDVESERGRSDVIVLAHISDDRESVHLVHFPRDYFVEIPGHSNKNKINAAYAFGGAPLLVETLQPLIGVPIDHVAITDFESFQAMTDAIGGVDVEVRHASPGFPEGSMHMDGETGLEFVRERKSLPQGDISRGERQLAFIQAVLLKGLSRDTVTNPARLARVVDAATQNLVVDENLEVSQMRDLAFQMRGVRGNDIEFVTAPWQGLGTDPVAGSVVVPHEEQLQVLAEHLQTDTMADYTDEVSPREGFGG
ncbi:LCP family protein [Ornithinicoccus halotolerans]|uniref:LCP family protein n=1 Tax=Ornithinicoccus halotolerans TaxID=1748220 RepID=UPI001E5403CA|nr:LCP family protein [Ornithinicoccus halotolerans]